MKCKTCSASWRHIRSSRFPSRSLLTRCSKLQCQWVLHRICTRVAYTWLVRVQREPPVLSITCLLTLRERQRESGLARRGGDGLGRQKGRERIISHNPAGQAKRTEVTHKPGSELRAAEEEIIGKTATNKDLERVVTKVAKVAFVIAPEQEERAEEKAAIARGCVTYSSATEGAGMKTSAGSCTRGMKPEQIAAQEKTRGVATEVPGNTQNAADGAQRAKSV